MKKKFVIFSVLVATLFAVGIVSASASTSSGNTNRLVSAGLPCDILFSLPSGNFGNISSANVWIANTSAGATTISSTQDGWNPHILFNPDDSALSAADVLITNFGDSFLRRFTSTLPFNPWNVTSGELSRLNVALGLGVRSSIGSTRSQTITRSYNIRVPYQDNAGQWVWGNASRVFNSEYSVHIQNDQINYITIPLFTEQELQSVLDSLRNDGYDMEQAIVSSIDLYLQDNYAGRYESIYLNNSTRTDDLYAFIRQIAADSLGDLYEVSVSYDSLDWTKWLKNAVEGFMGLEIVPGLPIWGIVSAALGIPLLIWFLRMFAGG